MLVDKSIVKKKYGSQCPMIGNDKITVKMFFHLTQFNWKFPDKQHRGTFKVKWLEHYKTRVQGKEKKKVP